jgi:hypothetical protein
MFTTGHIDPFWNDEFKSLSFKNEPFSNQENVTNWVKLGYDIQNFTGDMYVADPQIDIWAKPFFNLFPGSRVGVTFYKMKTCVIMPTHVDSFYFFIKNNKDIDQLKIKRAVVFLEPWKSGHVLEVEGIPFTNWKAGDYVIWSKHSPHLAANIGVEPRYTVQITYVDV